MTPNREDLTAALSQRYRIERELGSGGMATVYLAEDLKHQRWVAIKVLKPELAAPLGTERFSREIQLAAKLNHPHILALHDSGETEGFFYYVMPFVEGESLRERLDRDTQLPLDQALGITQEVAEGLSYAHSLGIVHRDIKPENILMSGGHALIADFGIARAVSVAGGDRLTEAGMAVGTLDYMSPEQVSGYDVDARTDTYALGCLLFEMLIGEPPYTGPTAAAALSRKLMGAVPSLRIVREAIPAGVERAIVRALAKAPADRFQSTSEFAEALRLAGAELQGIGWPEDRGSTPEIPWIKSLVVLPLDNLSGDPGQEYFVDGMTEAIIGELARIGAFLVISRTSAKRYRHTDKSIPEIARELNVDAVVEGSVLRAEHRIRITVQLIEGREDRHLWSQSYERDLRDVLVLQREVAQAVAGEIQVALSPTDQRQMAPATEPRDLRRPDPEAYDAYLKGRYYHARWGQGEFEEMAIRFYEEATAKDSTFAKAHAALAEALLGLSYVVPNKLPLGRAAAERAVELDPSLSEAHAALALARNLDWDWEGSEAAFKRAIELDPNSSMAHQWYAQLLRDLMRLEDALREAQKARELDPLSLPVNTMVGWVLFNQHRFDDAIVLWNYVLELDPNYALAIYNKGLAYGMKGMGNEVISAARDAAKRWEGEGGRLPTTWLLGIGYALSGQREQATAILRELEGQHSTQDWIAALHLVLGEEGTALDWLEKAYEEHVPGLPSIMSEPWFDRVRDHPRFRALRTKTRLP